MVVFRLIVIVKFDAHDYRKSGRRTGPSPLILAHELGIKHVYQGIKDKPILLESIAKKQETPLSEIAYIGDDLNDYEAMALCGFKACPADAAQKIVSA